MNRENFDPIQYTRDRWLPALRDPERFVQAPNSLVVMPDRGMLPGQQEGPQPACCLGVLALLLIEDGIIDGSFAPSGTCSFGKAGPTECRLTVDGQDAGASWLPDSVSTLMGWGGPETVFPGHGPTLTIDGVTEHAGYFNDLSGVTWAMIADAIEAQVVTPAGGTADPEAPAGDPAGASGDGR